MKTKDIIYLTIATIVFVISGLIIYSQLAPARPAQTKNTETIVERITPIEASFNDTALARIQTKDKVKDFYTEPNLKQGIGNSQPFTPIR